MAEDGEVRRTTGWLLHPYERTALLKRYIPAYLDVVAHHVTLRSGPHALAVLPDHVSSKLVGRVDDGKGLEALIVEVNGATQRPDAGTFHVTWSLDRAAGRDAHESNQIIARLGWQAFDVPCPVMLMPAYWESTLRS